MCVLTLVTVHCIQYSYVINRKWTHEHTLLTGLYFLSHTQSLVVLDFLIKSGSERVTVQCKENMFSIQTLKDFQYMDKEGKDQGTNGVWACVCVVEPVVCVCVRVGWSQRWVGGWSQWCVCGVEPCVGWSQWCGHVCVGVLTPPLSR